MSQGSIAPQRRVFTPIWGLGSDLDSLVPDLGNALGVVGIKTSFAHSCSHKKNDSNLGDLFRGNMTKF